MEVENEASCSPSSATASGGSREYKVVMLGAGGVGKSAMTMQFISHQFPDYHDPTIEDAYKTQVRIDNEPAYLDILDTAGQAEFTAMREQYMRGGEGFIVCYSVTDRQSFQEAAKFKELIFQVRHTYEIPLVLVGNKIDLEQFRQIFHLAFQPMYLTMLFNARHRMQPMCKQLFRVQKALNNCLKKVSTEEGLGLAREYNCAFFETSAALRFCIDDAFHGLVREIRKKESVPSLTGKKLKRKDSLWKKLKGSLKKKRENLAC